MKNLPNILKEAKATRERLDYEARLVTHPAQDMADPKNWREGDVVEWMPASCEGLTRGNRYTLHRIAFYDACVMDDDGDERLRSPREFRWISR